jgi:formylglycine-generating enzyme required for sulfatase activity
MPLFFRLAPALLGAYLFTGLPAVAPAEAGQTSAIQPKMVALTAGSFSMGGPRASDERPEHTVNVAAFELGKHEVTFDEWDACVADSGCEHRPDDMGWGRGKRPVIYVSYDDIQQYLTWINRKTGKQYRLPSEAEWEYAARAGATTRFSSGDCITTDQANFDGINPAEGCSKGEFRKQTLPVGSFAANPWGLHDMHGNVWEWVQDCWNNSHTGAPDNGAARTDGNCGQRVLRGGAWDSLGYKLRSSYRLNSRLDYRNMPHIGFRLAKSR